MPRTKRVYTATTPAGSRLRIQDECEPEPVEEQAPGQCADCYSSCTDTVPDGVKCDAYQPAPPPAPKPATRMTWHERFYIKVAVALDGPMSDAEFRAFVRRCDEEPMEEGR